MSLIGFLRRRPIDFDHIRQHRPQIDRPEPVAADAGLGAADLQRRGEHGLESLCLVLGGIERRSRAVVARAGGGPFDDRLQARDR